MKQFIIPIVSGVVGIIIPIAGMMITPTRNLMLKLAPQELASELPSKVGEDAVLMETKLQEMQSVLEIQQSKINEQEKKIEELKTSKDAVTKEDKQATLVNQKAWLVQKLIESNRK